MGGYIQALYSIINQVRYQRQPFCELKVLVMGHQASEISMQQLCVLDANNSSYRKPYDKFIAELSTVRTSRFN
jgi:hypothetical protein